MHLRVNTRVYLLFLIAISIALPTPAETFTGGPDTSSVKYKRMIQIDSPSELDTGNNDDITILSNNGDVDAFGINNSNNLAITNSNCISLLNF